MTTLRTCTFALAALVSLSPASLRAQTVGAAPTAQAAGAPRQSGTIKAVTPKDFVLTSAAGQDFAVTVGASTRILLVDPVTKDVKNARPGTMSDLAGGDKAIVTGTTGDAGQTLTATRVLLLKSGDIAAMHAGEQAAWAHSVGGIVKTFDAATGTLDVVNGTRSYVIHTSANTTVRRYTGASVRFEDAVKSPLSAIRPGDQVQARGTRTDATTVAADEIVAGSFSNYSGVLSAVDAGAGTVTLKDLATKQAVTVAVSGQTNLRKLPAGYGQGTAASTGPANSPAGQGGAAAGASEGNGKPAATTPGARGGAGRVDLSRVMNRLPTETLAELKPGDAVMIVASNAAEGSMPTAITLLSGVEQILAASPAGGTTLSPWSLGGGEGEGGEGSSGGGGR